MMAPDVCPGMIPSTATVTDIYSYGQHCWLCSYWSPISKRSRQMPHNSAGACRRYAPRPTTDAKRVALVDVGWPATFAGDWCGEFNLMFIP